MIQKWLILVVVATYLKLQWNVVRNSMSRRFSSIVFGEFGYFHGDRPQCRPKAIVALFNYMFLMLIEFINPNFPLYMAIVVSVVIVILFI
jgi:hypothetical protein